MKLMPKSRAVRTVPAPVIRGEYGARVAACLEVLFLSGKTFNDRRRLCPFLLFRRLGHQFLKLAVLQEFGLRDTSRFGTTP